MGYYPSFNEPPPPSKGSSYIWDPNFVSSNGTTGQYRPYSTVDAYSSSLMVSAPTGTNLTSTTLTSGLLLAANPNRIAYVVQPYSSGGYLLLGTGLVNPTNYHIYLPSGTVYSDNSWKGPISAYLSGAFSCYQTS